MVLRTLPVECGFFLKRLVGVTKASHCMKVHPVPPLLGSNLQDTPSGATETARKMALNL
jgi:hypothetical protein